MTARTLLLIVLAAGCSNEAQPPATTSQPPATTSQPPATTSTPPATTSTPPATTPQPPANAGAAGACADIRRRFDAALGKRTDACSTAADCGCYNPVGGPHLGCGGVTDAATVAQLAAIEKDFHAQRCTWTHNCAAWACAPRCVDRRCTQ